MPNTSQELIPISKRGDSQQWVDARTLHQFLQVGKDFSNWIKGRIDDYGFVEGRDFSPILAKSTGGRQAIEYSLTLDMAKELSMLERNEQGKQARQYFIQAEKQLRQLQAHLLAGYDETAQLLALCQSCQLDGHTWYKASQLRTLAGKGANGSYSRVLRDKLVHTGQAMLLTDGNQQKWYIRQDAVPRLLGVKSSTATSVAMVKLLNTGGTKW
jgi:phage anti-repressor protein